MKLSPAGILAPLILLAMLAVSASAAPSSNPADPADTAVPASSSAYITVPDSMTALIGLPITELRIVTTRVSEDVVRTMIRVGEGDKFEEHTLQDIRARLAQSTLFKKISVNASSDAAGNGVRVNLDLWDGWFLIPFPFVTSGGGGLNASLLLVERNFFKRAETISAFMGGNEDGASGSANVQLPSVTVNARLARRSIFVWNYADGAFNTTGRFRSSRAEDEPQRFGAIANQYTRKIEEFGFEIRKTFFRKIGTSLGFSTQKNDYRELVAGGFPADAGLANAMTFGLNYRLGTRRAAGMLEPGFSFSDFGAIFGFGLADIEERLKPLARRSYQVMFDWGVEQSDRSVGSDFNYTKMHLSVLPAIRFLNRQTLSLRIRGSAGLREDLPLNQRVATGRELGLRGNYAREYRGDRGAGASLGFSYPFRRTRLGSWTAESFLEGAGVWRAGRGDGKSGIGVGLTYQFWRFPLPLGVIYSHSFDDGDGQINAAIGGRF